MTRIANADLLTRQVAVGLQILKGWPRVERPLARLKKSAESATRVDSVVEELVREDHITTFAPVVQGG